MKSKDLIAKEQAALQTALAEAIQAGDTVAMSAAFTGFAAGVQEAVLADARELAQVEMMDEAAMVGNGMRRLTAKEKTWYEGIMDAMKGDPKATFTGIDVIMPETVIDAVMEDIVQKHPLLEAVNFVNTMGAVKMVVNAQGIQTAAWGKLTAAFTQELSAAFTEINVGLKKLSAYMPVSKAILDLGPQWLDRYVRAVLSESVAVGMESGIVDGDGNDKPIGMTRNLKGSVVEGAYPKKTAVVVTDFSPETYGSLLSAMAKDDNDRPRIIEEVILVVNPADYFTKVMPAVTMLTSAGVYAQNVLPFPTKIIQSAALTSGSAVLGIGMRYFAALGSAKEGKIEYDDSVKFMEDNRVYAVKLYGEGRPLDNKAFTLLDISGLKPLSWGNTTVNVTNEIANGGTAGA